MPLLLKESAGGLKTTPDTCFDVRHDITPLRNQWKKLHEEEPEHRPTTSLNRLIGAETSSIVTIGCGGSRGAGSRLATGTSVSTVEHPSSPSTLLLPSYGRAADGWSMWRLTERTRLGHMDVNAQIHNDRTEDASYVNTQTHMQSAHLPMPCLTLT